MTMVQRVSSITEITYQVVHAYNLLYTHLYLYAARKLGITTPLRRKGSSKLFSSFGSSFLWSLVLSWLDFISLKELLLRY